MLTTKNFGQAITKDFKQDKLKTRITIEQFNNTNFFVVKWEKGATPKSLSGKYSSIAKAEEAINAYLRTIKQSPAAKYSKKDKENGSGTIAETSNSI